MESQYANTRRDENYINRTYKSWGEEQIARFLGHHKITFQYEYPLALVDRGQVKIWYPDFRLPEYGIIIEYFGVNGDAGYKERTEHKLSVYRQAGIEGIFLTEQSFRGDWPGKILAGIESLMKSRLDKFHSVRTDGGGVR